MWKRAKSQPTSPLFPMIGLDFASRALFLHRIEESSAGQLFHWTSMVKWTLGILGSWLSITSSVDKNRRKCLRVFPCMLVSLQTGDLPLCCFPCSLHLHQHKWREVHVWDIPLTNNYMNPSEDVTNEGNPSFEEDPQRVASLCIMCCHNMGLLQGTSLWSLSLVGCECPRLETES